MKLVSYQTNSPETSLRELGNLCYKFLKSRKVVSIQVANEEVAKQISEAFWKSHHFIPHGVEGQEFDAIQPIMISTTPQNRDILINFEQVLVKHTDLKHPYYSFILWNCEAYSKEFDKYQQDHNGRWFKMYSGIKYFND